MAYTNLSDFISMREGDAAPDDVMIDEAEPETPETPEPAIAVSDDAERSEPAGEEDAAPTPEAVSEAARVLSSQKNETKREKRIRQIQEEIDQLTKTKATAKAEADAEEQRLASLRAQRAQPDEKPADKPAPVAEKKPLVRPTPPDSSQVGSAEMPDWDAYMAKQAEFAAQMADYSVANATTAAREAVQEERQRAAHEAAIQVWQGRVEAAKAKHADFDAVVGNNPHLHISPELGQLIMQDPDPASTDVAYYLGTHIEESHRIARLAPLAQAMEYGRLKAALPQAPSSTKTGPTPSAKPVSRTPAPVPPVGVASVSTQVPTERYALADWIAKRNAEEDRNGRL